MPGKKYYNPKGYEPDAHEPFEGPPPEAMDAYRKALAEQRARRSAFTYEEAMGYRQRGESHILGHYVYEMMYAGYYGMEDELVAGSWDTHLHIYPDYVPRCIDMVDLAIKASKEKMGGIVCKDHFFSNTTGAWGAQWVVDDLVRRGELDYACKILGTNILAFSYHPDQVHLIRKYPNLGAVFFPTMTGGGPGRAGPLMPIIDAKGKLMPEVKTCIDLCAKYKIPIMTGHRSWDERYAMAREAQEVGASMLLTHGGGLHGITTAQAVKLNTEARKYGVFIEVNGNAMLPNMMWPQINPNDTLDFLKEMGPENLIFGSDFGQLMSTDPIDTWKLLIRMMMFYGIPDKDIEMMIKTNPVKFLLLDE